MSYPENPEVVSSYSFQIYAYAWSQLKLTGLNLGQVFKSRFVHVCIVHELYTLCKTAQLKVENSAQTTLGFLPLAFELPAGAHLWVSEGIREGRKKERVGVSSM
jgi:hypothetical protein